MFSDINFCSFMSVSTNFTVKIKIILITCKYRLDKSKVMLQHRISNKLEDELKEINDDTEGSKVTLLIFISCVFPTVYRVRTEFLSLLW